MNSYKNIEQKLHQFVRKFYMNELIKGGILFFSLGFLYFFFTLFIEYFLWLKPTARTVLFWMFIFVEFYLSFRFILTPIFKIIGIKKGISKKDSSKIIGNHFPKVGDKLINILQLKETENHSELLIASIEQKSKDLQLIPFAKAIPFRRNTKYLKYAIFPLLIWFLLNITGNGTIFSSSLNRVVNHRTSYNPPAPFTFLLTNKKLKVIQGKPFTIAVKTLGKIVPSSVKVFYNNQSYYLQSNNGLFTYTFTDTTSPILFYMEANGIVSEDYLLETIQTPVIKNISIDLQYPQYLRKVNEKIENTGSVLIPEGTKITWNVFTNQTDSISFIEKQQQAYFSSVSKDVFTFKKTALHSFNYHISSSNSFLQSYEKLFFKVEVVKDEFPQIEVLSDIDSLTSNSAQFAGKISDDYGLKKLEIVYYNEDTPNQILTQRIAINKKQQQTFYSIFPDTLQLQEGVNYEVYFQVFDNDGVNGSKKSKSKVFHFRKKSETEISEEAIKEQRKQIYSIENTLQKQQQQKKALEEIKQNLQNKKNINWNDKNKIDNFIKRQEQYKQMMQRQTNKLQKNIKDLPNDSKSIQEKKEQLKKRIDELKALEKQQKLLEELKKLAKKLTKNDLLKKVKKLSEQNKQQERSLERVLELTKRFYVEQKTMQIAQKLEELSKKQEEVRKAPKATLKEQKEVKKDFKKIQKELNDLQKDNKALKEPMQIPDTKTTEKEIEKALNKAEKNNQQKKKQNQNQQKAAKKMQQMSQQMQQAMMAMEEDMKEANEKTLRIILENLLSFSFKQEDLMNRFSKIDVAHPDFGKEIRNQNTLKTYFKHIDDSLYVLSMRLPEISVKIQKDLTDSHYNLDQSLENFAENKFINGQSNQQYVMTSVNNLADFLSTILDNMQQPKMSKSGKGKKGGKSFSLPDIIKKQEAVMKKLQKGKQEQNGQKKGGKKKRGKENKKNDFDGELYKIYQEQSQLREELQNALKKNNKGKNAAAQSILKSMEQLENEILEKGFNLNTVQKMQELKYNLLKLDKAAFEQDKDKRRKSTTNQSQYQQKKATLFLKKLFYNQIEILNRQSLPLQKNYKKKVREYFSNLKGGKKND